MTYSVLEMESKLFQVLRYDEEEARLMYFHQSGDS